jgi:pimeloyl-ACP methyl ester carboxylesterase
VAAAAQLSLEDRLRQALFPWLYTPAFLADAARVEEALARALAYPFPTRAEALARQGAGLHAWNGTRRRDLRRLRVPALVLVGREDILTPPAFSRQVAALIPGARLRLLAGGHAFFVEEAAAVNRALLGFWGGLARTGRRR